MPINSLAIDRDPSRQEMPVDDDDTPPALYSTGDILRTKDVPRSRRNLIAKAASGR
jgi:hypothetical protein